METLKSQAIQKIDSELKAYKGDRYGEAMKNKIAEVIKNWCNQNEEFAQAVAQGGSFADCMKEVVKQVKGSYADSDSICPVVAEFYFPGAVVEETILIRMSKYEAEEASGSDGGILLRLEDFL